MKKKITKKIRKENFAYTFTGEPIDVSNCIQVGETIKFPEYDINKKIQKKLLKNFLLNSPTKKYFPPKKIISLIIIHKNQLIKKKSLRK